MPPLHTLTLRLFSTRAAMDNWAHRQLAEDPAARWNKTTTTLWASDGNTLCRVVVDAHDVERLRGYRFTAIHYEPGAWKRTRWQVRELFDAVIRVST